MLFATRRRVSPGRLLIGIYLIGGAVAGLWAIIGAVTQTFGQLDVAVALDLAAIFLFAALFFGLNGIAGWAVVIGHRYALRALITGQAFQLLAFDTGSHAFTARAGFSFGPVCDGSAWEWTVGWKVAFQLAWGDASVGQLFAVNLAPVLIVALATVVLRQLGDPRGDHTRDLAVT